MKNEEKLGNLVQFKKITACSHQIIFSFLVATVMEKSKLDATSICNHHCPLWHPVSSLGYWYAFAPSIQAKAVIATTFPGFFSPGNYKSSECPHLQLYYNGNNAIDMILKLTNYFQKEVWYLTPLAAHRN